MNEGKKTKRKIAFDIENDDAALFAYFTNDIKKISPDVDIATRELFKRKKKDAKGNVKWVNRNMSTIEIFSLAALVGKFIYESENNPEVKQSLKEQMVLIKHKAYVRFEQGESNAKTIIKAIAVSETGDINILKDENRVELAKYSEGYAKIGIKKLYTWATSQEFDFETELSDILLSYDDKYH